MKLYYVPGACSLSPHIVLREAGVPFQLDRVSFSTRKTESGADFSSVIKLNYYAVDVARLAEIRAVRDEYLTSPPPASTFVVVKGLVRPELLIEIEAIVALP